MAEYELEIIEKYPSITLYSLRFKGEENNEFEKFVLKFPEDSEYDEDMQKVISWLDRIIKKGALERYFRNEGHYGSGVKAIPIEVNNLRLYCYRFSDHVLILGNGDVKDVQRWQESEVLSPFVQQIIDAEKSIKHRLRNHELSVINNEFIGSLTFKSKNHDEK